MKCLNRNKSKFYYANYLKKIPLNDEYGNFTGEYELVFDNPQETFANISAAQGETQTRQFGENEVYDKVIVMDNYMPSINEYSILWVDKMCIRDRWRRDPDKKFYPPRRKVLKQVVAALQELSDDKLDLLAISMPPGSGKTTLAIFYLTWLAGKNPNEPMLTGSHSNSFIRGVYDECLRILDANGEYLWHDVFPNINVSGTNAKDCRIDLDKRQRFETLEFTSIGTGNACLLYTSRCV